MRCTGQEWTLNKPDDSAFLLLARGAQRPEASPAPIPQGWDPRFPGAQGESPRDAGDARERGSSSCSDEGEAAGLLASLSGWPQSLCGEPGLLSSPAVPMFPELLPEVALGRSHPPRTRPGSPHVPHSARISRRFQMLLRRPRRSAQSDPNAWRGNALHARPPPARTRCPVGKRLPVHRPRPTTGTADAWSRGLTGHTVCVDTEAAG